MSLTCRSPPSHCCSLPPVLMAYRYWVLGQHWKFLCLSGLAIIVFRTELSILLGLMLLGEVFSGRLSIYHTIKICVPAGAAILGEIVCTEYPVHVHQYMYVYYVYSVVDLLGYYKPSTMGLYYECPLLLLLMALLFPLKFVFPF